VVNITDGRLTVENAPDGNNAKLSYLDIVSNDDTPPGTSVPPTNTPVSPTNTPIPSTATVVPTNTAVPPTPAPDGKEININFQRDDAPIPAGYLPDTGLTFTDQNGESYGWQDDNTGNTRYYSWYTDDDRLASFTHLQRGGGKWEIALPNGIYQVSGVSGDPQYSNQVNNLLIEGIRIEDTVNGNNFDPFTVVVNITDGRLTVENAPDGNNVKLSYLDIVSNDDTPPSTSVPPTNTPESPTSTPEPPITPTPGSYPSPGGSYPSPGDNLP